MATANETPLNGTPAKIPDILECSLCTDTVKVPKVLPCVHTFCFECLKAYCPKNPSEDEKIPCPQCRKIFSIPAGGIRNLPDNFFLQRLLEVTVAVAIHASPCAQYTCQLCMDWEKQADATFYCAFCDQHICKRCHVAHKNSKGTRDHLVVRNIEIKSLSELDKFAQCYCEQHQTEFVRLYCYVCVKLMCPLCACNHIDHKTTNVEDSAKKFRERLKKSADEVLEHAGRRREELNEMKNDTECFVDAVSATEKEISKQFDRFVSLLQVHRKKLTTELSEFKERILKGKERRKDEAERRYVTAETFRRYCVEVATRGTPCDVSRTAHELLARAAEMVAVRNDEPARQVIEVKFEPSFRSGMDSLTNRLGELILKEELDFRVLLRRPQSARVIINTGYITGLAVLGAQGFVTRGTAQIDVYETNSFHEVLRTLPIPGSKDLYGIVACSHHNCLYASDPTQMIIYRYDLASDVTTSWPVKGISYELSLTRSFNVLCMSTQSDSKQRVDEYDTHGKFVRQIKLDGGMDGVRHCVQLSSTGHYVVCHAGQDYQVSVVDQDGRVVHRYGKSGEGEGMNPVHLCVDAYENILIADGNNRVTLLSASLAYLGELVVAGEEGVYSPDSLHLDERNRRLYVKEYNSEQILVMDFDE